jgi:hypothetical protein
MARKAKCSFCDAGESLSCTVLHRVDRDPREGPFICERCVAQANAVLREEREEEGHPVYVSTSEVHGRGVFAARRIPKGAYVGTYEGLDDVDFDGHLERYVIFMFDEGADDDEPSTWRLGTNEFRFLNHDDDANLEMDESYHFWATRTIKRDEELTWFYGEEFSENWAKKKP